jgi:hypothetical protein
MVDATPTIRLADIPRRWFTVAAVGCLALALVMTALLLAGGAVAAAASVLVFDLALAALAFGIARSAVDLGPGATVVVTNGYRRRPFERAGIERVDVIRSGVTGAPRRAKLVLVGGASVQLLATDGAGRSADEVARLAAQIEAFVHAGEPT